jgi:dihydroneopterin aldolase
MHVDRVLIEGLRVDAVIGVYGWEREVRQTLVIDLVMGWDNRTPGGSDDIEQALNYAQVAEEVTAWVGGSAFQLLEALAEGLAAWLLERFGMHGLRLTIRKPGAVPNALAVGVEIERGDLIVKEASV